MSKKIRWSKFILIYALVGLLCVSSSSILGALYFGLDIGLYIGSATSKYSTEGYLETKNNATRIDKASDGAMIGACWGCVLFSLFLISGIKAMKSNKTK